MSRRRHLAIQWRIEGGVSILRCVCGEWESNPAQTFREQRIAHRAHRVEMGETVQPLAPTQAERLAAAEATITRVRKAMANTLLQGPNAILVVRLADLRTALDGPAVISEGNIQIEQLHGEL